MSLPVVLIFLYGLAAGFLLVRLQRKKQRHGREWRLLVIAGWVMVGVSLMLAAGLFGWMLVGAGL